jgi:hypothetical protein
MNKLLCGQDINEDESSVLSRFILSQHLRTPARLAAFTKNWHVEMPKLYKAASNAAKIIKENPTIVCSSLQIPSGAERIPIKSEINNSTNLFGRIDKLYKAS